MAGRLDGELYFGVFPLGLFDGVGGHIVNDLLHRYGVLMDGEDAYGLGQG